MIYVILYNGLKAFPRKTSALVVLEVRRTWPLVAILRLTFAPPVCGIETDYNLADNSSTIKKVIPIAGEYTSSHGRPLDPNLTRLKNSASHGDAEREGVRVELNGGRYPLGQSSGRQQKAIIEFVCDPDSTGLEDVEGDSREKIGDDESEQRSIARAEDGEKEGDGEDGGEGDKDGESPEKPEPPLKLISYKPEGDADRQLDVLRLEWRTKYACEGQTGQKPSPSKSSHWGFFTWFLIM